MQRLLNLLKTNPFLSFVIIFVVVIMSLYVLLGLFSQESKQNRADELYNEQLDEFVRTYENKNEEFYDEDPKYGALRQTLPIESELYSISYENNLIVVQLKTSRYSDTAYMQIYNYLKQFSINPGDSRLIIRDFIDDGEPGV